MFTALAAFGVKAWFLPFLETLFWAIQDKHVYEWKGILAGIVDWVVFMPPVKYMHQNLNLQSSEMWSHLEIFREIIKVI